MLKTIRRVRQNSLLGYLLVALSSLFYLLASFSNVHAAGASFFLAPSTGTYVIGGNFSVSVKLNTGGQIINTVDGQINFDKNLLEVKSVSTGGSLVNLWITQPSFSNSAGTVSFSGGVTPPGYNGTAGHICTITFKTKAAGDAQIHFTSGAILANDGKGTNILASMGSGSYKVSPKVDVPKVDTPKNDDSKSTTPANDIVKEEVEVEIELDYNKPSVKSDTHPDSNSWYNSLNGKFLWELPEGVTGVSVAFDQDPNSDPGPESDGLFSEKEYTIEGDGIWYLHVKFKDSKKWGTINHFRVMIDTNSPLPFEVRVSEVKEGEWPELQFEAKDKESGLSGYEIFVSSLEKQAHTLGAEDKTIKLSNLEVGKHTVMVKAIDKAGNERVETIEFEVKPIESPKISNYSAGIKPSDDFFINGTVNKDYVVNLFLTDDKNNIIASEVVQPDMIGNWFYIYNNELSKGRYTVWAESENKNGLRSAPSERISFLVSPPVFMEIGSFIIDYFTALVSLLFMIILVIISIMYIAGYLRRRLKKETVEVEDVLKNNLDKYQKIIDDEFEKLAKFESDVDYKKKKTATKMVLKKKIAAMESQILKEVKDVEDLLK